MEELLHYHAICSEKTISGRYILPETLRQFLKELPEEFKVKTVGHSVEGRQIDSIKLGSGSVKVFLWSQMHGNESTTTKALLDLLNAFQDTSAPEVVRRVFAKCTFYIIPMLNPDGAAQWTRENANGIDINRDAQRLTQPESKVLRGVFDSFKPDICFNLHGQRTIYGFEDGSPSVLSFLSPAADAMRSVTLARKRAMHIITAIYKGLTKYLPNKIGRYDDGFNLNCVGDTFQSLGVPTVLYEAGHFPGDYEREQTRKYVFAALVLGLQASGDNKTTDTSSYFEIPEHTKNYCDVLIKNARLTDGGALVSLQIMFRETVKGENVYFVPFISEISTDDRVYGHRVIDAKCQIVKALKSKKIEQCVDVRQLLIGEHITITL